jgi:hypothetical protein
MQAGEIGNPFTFSVSPTDISGATSWSIIITRPDGVRTAYAAALGSDHMSATLSNTTPNAPLFPISGRYLVQLTWTFVNGNFRESSVQPFDVGQEL